MTCIEPHVTVIADGDGNELEICCTAEATGCPATTRR